ncbi:hypothetical protein Tco_0377931 [Tanacetum coccineum]
MLGEAQGGVPTNQLWHKSNGNRIEQGSTYKSVIMGVSHDLRGIPSSVEGGTMEGVGLRVANYHTVDPFRARRGGLRAGGEGTSSGLPVEYSIVPSDCPELLPKDNSWDKKSFKDKLPLQSMKIACFSDLVEIDFKNFMYVEDDKELSFLYRELSPGFGTGSPSVLINNEPPLVEAKPLDVENPKQLVENTTDSRRSPPHEEMLVVGSGSVAERMKSRKCITKGSTKPPMKRRLVQAGSSSSATRQNTSLSKADSTSLIVSDDEGGLSDVLELQNATACHLKISNITPQAWRGHLDNQAGYQENLTTLKSKVASLEAEKAKLEVTKASLRQEVKTVKCDRMDVVSKVEPYVAMELVQSDEMGRLAIKLVSSVVFYGRCVAFEEVADMKEPFDLTKVKGYRPSCKKEHTKVGNDLGTATFPFLSKAIVNPFAQIEALLSKKPRSLRLPTLTKTHFLYHQSLLRKPLILLILYPRHCLLPQALEGHHVGANSIPRVACTLLNNLVPCSLGFGLLNNLLLSGVTVCVGRR